MQNSFLSRGSFARIKKLSNDLFIICAVPKHSSYPINFEQAAIQFFQVWPFLESLLYPGFKEFFLFSA